MFYKVDTKNGTCVQLTQKYINVLINGLVHDVINVCGYCNDLYNDDIYYIDLDFSNSKRLDYNKRYNEVIQKIRDSKIDMLL